MARPVDFPEKNFLKGKPAEMTDEECGALPCFIDDIQVISCWELTPEELAEVARTGKVWVSVMAPVSTPPMWIQGVNPFVQPADAEQ